MNMINSSITLYLSNIFEDRLEGIIIILVEFNGRILVAPSRKFK